MYFLRSKSNFPAFFEINLIFQRLFMKALQIQVLFKSMWTRHLDWFEDILVAYEKHTKTAKAAPSIVP